MSILMLNGKNDPNFACETSQVALFNLLGTPVAQKRHVTHATGHSVHAVFDEMVREPLGWLDTVFEPVNPAGSR